MTLTQISDINYNLGLNIEEYFEFLGFSIIEFIDSVDSIRGPAICHSGDNPTGFTYYKDTMLWSCWTRSCQDLNYSDLIGLLCCVKDIKRRQAVVMAKDFLKNKEIYKLKKQNVKKDETDYIKEHLQQKKYHSDIMKKLGKNLSYLEKRGFDRDTMFKIGCGNFDKGVMQDRIVFPIKDLNSCIVGFTGRTVVENQYKWKNTIFKKSLNLINLDVCKKFIEKKQLDKVIITEGPLDVLKLCEAGYWNSLGLLGAKVTKGQIELLKKIGVNSIVLIMDNDEAGRNLEGKNSKLLQQSLLNVESIFPSRKDVGDMKKDEIRKMLRDIKWR